MTTPTEQPRPTRTPAAVAASLSTLALTAGSIAEADEQSATWFGVEGPHCPIRIAGDETLCPGCGLTRATSLTLQAESSRAVAIHPAGPLIAVLLVLTLALSVDRLCRSDARPWHRIGARWLQRCFVVGLFLSWLWRAFVR